MTIADLFNSEQIVSSLENTGLRSGLLLMLELDSFDTENSNIDKGVKNRI